MNAAMHQLINKAIYFDQLKLFALDWEAADKSFLPKPADGLEARALTPQEIERFAQDPGNNLHLSYAHDAIGNRDICFALLDNGRLANYNWYSRKPTILTGEFRLHFPSSFWYMHHSWTPAAFRGRRLHTIGILAAFAQFAADGGEHMLCVVSATNHASLKSTGRAGYRQVGCLWMSGVAGRYFLRADRGCRKMACHVEPMRADVRFTALNTQRFVVDGTRDGGGGGGDAR